MKIYYIPEKLKGLIFDIDLTLYNNTDYYNYQTEVLIKKLASEKRRTFKDIKHEVELYKKEYSKKFNGRKPSLGNTFLSLGIPIKKSVKWREELHRPENFLKKDRILKRTLSILKEHFKLIAVTNNPSSVGIRTLKVLGIKELFIKVIGLDNSMVSKPHKIPFKLAQNEMNLKYTELVSIGDRYEIDIEIPLKLGMGGILVENMEDIYKLPDILLQYGK
jgi:FMN phosphatase YigB (HAD superfamily)